MNWKLGRGLAVLAVAMGLSAQTGAEERPPGQLSGREAAAIAARLVPAPKDPKGWATDIHRALERNSISPTRSNLCAVLAVIGQESTYTANPEVKGLGAMAEKEIDARLSALPLVSQGANWFLRNKPTPQKSYLSLIRAATTERDLDLVFRNMAFFLFRDFASTRLLNTASIAARVDAVNPVSTLGSMQVSVAFAITEVERARKKRLGLSEIWKLREELYTRPGGVTYGTRMLLGYRAAYPSRLYVFADYNAGRYASRNAAFQHMVAELSGKDLALDGDLLAYDGETPKPDPSATEQSLRGLKLGLDDKAIRADLAQGKTYGFKDTETYARVAAAFKKKKGRKPPYAMLPQIRLKSPKIRHAMTTEIFARAVMARYEKCMRAR